MENKSHNELHLIGRSDLSLTGIEDIKNFDDNQIELVIGDEALIIQGYDLHMNNLSLETGNVSISGTIQTIFFDDGTVAPKKGLFRKGR
ncbi:MAG: YabP/YqfC family sporulation protein [Firmicutes bacterium]|nr:YabP/YqfC family sporulation protein [Bacillota bacterium]